jgi:hypothetical protein
MTLTYVGGATASNSNGGTASSLVVNVPAGTQDGDFMITVGHKNPTTSATITTPSGWSVFEGPDANSGITCFAYIRTASSEPASYTWTQTGATPSAIYGVGTFSFRGYDPSNIIGTAAVSTAYTTAQTTTAPSLSPDQRSMIFTYRGSSWSGTTEPTMSTTNAGTKAADWGFDGGVSGRSSSVFYSAVQPPGTYAYDVTLSSNIATNSIMYAFAIYELQPVMPRILPITSVSVMTSTML